MGRCGSKNGHQEYMCLNNIELHVQYLLECSKLGGGMGVAKGEFPCRPLTH